MVSREIRLENIGFYGALVDDCDGILSPLVNDMATDCNVSTVGWGTHSLVLFTDGLSSDRSIGARKRSDCRSKTGVFQGRASHES